MQYFVYVVEMASNDIIDDLHKGEKLDGDNFRQKNIQYIINEHEILENQTSQILDLRKVIPNNINVILLPMKIGARKIVVFVLLC